MCPSLPAAAAPARISVILRASSATVPSSGVLAVALSSAPPVIGIQPCACSVTRRRLRRELPPTQIGMGRCTGRGLATTSRALKWRPV